MSKEGISSEVAELSRRHFLTNAGKLVVGAAAGAAGLSVVACGQAAKPVAQAAAAAGAGQGTGAGATAPAWPWPYVQLDPRAVAETAYTGFYQGACMYGAFNAIVSALKEKVGAPYTMIPTEMAKYGEGGVVGWASLCGALNGSSAAINLCTKDYTPVVDELMGWYTTTALPTFVPANPKVKISATSVSDSPLCHVSVALWCKASGAKSESPERSERCARVAASVAFHAVELLNQHAAGTFKTTFKPAPAVATCGACHLKGGTVENVRGKMDCGQCHTPHKI